MITDSDFILSNRTSAICITADMSFKSRLELCFLVTRVNDRNTIDPEYVMLALTRLRDFMIERGITEVSMPVYDPNRGKLSPRELYATLQKPR